MPHVSVIVPTRDRHDLLTRLLESLQQQTYDDFEIIVVDDGSAEPVIAPRPVRVITTDGVGAVQARAIGVRQSTGDVLAFTDDDCIADPDWVRNGVAAIDAGADVAQGRTMPERGVRANERSIEHGAHDGLFPTCNVFYRRSAFDAAGGFDTTAGDRWRFRPGRFGDRLGFGEDAALGWTVARNGTAAEVPDALVRHAVVHTSWRESLFRAWMAGGFPALVREFPELRRTIVRRRVVLGRPDARLLAYGIVLLPIPGVQLVGVFSVLGWFVMRSQRYGAGAPRVLACDLAKNIALVVGSVRAGTLLV